MKSDEALAAEQALEQKLADVGADTVRRASGPSGSEPQTQDTPPDPEPQAEVDTPAAPAIEAPPAEPAAQGDDPAVAALLAKYGGDTTKALQAAVQLQKKLGEQGNELGQTRQQNAEYEQVIQELAALRQQVQQPQQQAPYVDQATADWFDQAVLENPTQAMEYARSNRNDLLFQRGLATWKDADPFGAAVYVNDIKNRELEARLAQQRPSNDSVELQSALNQVLSEHGEFVQYAGDLENVIQRYPSVAAGLSGDQKQKTDAIETLFALAERDTLRALALNHTTPAAPATEQAVAAPSTSEDRPEQEPAQPSGVDLFREQFRQEAARMTGERVVPKAFVAS